MLHVKTSGALPPLNCPGVLIATFWPLIEPPVYRIMISLSVYNKVVFFIVHSVVFF